MAENVNVMRSMMRWMDDMLGLPSSATRLTTIDGCWVSRRRVLNFCLRSVAHGRLKNASAEAVAVVVSRYSIVPEEYEAVRNILQSVLVQPAVMVEDVFDARGYDSTDEEGEPAGTWVGRDPVRPDSPRGAPSLYDCVDPLGEEYRWTLPHFGTAGLYGVPVHWRRE